jgi:hypothetical protein
MLSVQLGDRFTLRPNVMLFRLEQFNNQELMFHNPWQYRVLANWLLNAWIWWLSFLNVEFIGVSLAHTPQGSGFFAVAPNEWPLLIFKFLQNILLFVVASRFYRLFTREKILVYCAMIILAYALGLGNFDSDLSFNTYFDVIFYLYACLWILQKKYPYLLLLIIPAALNRETSALIPVLLFVQGIDFRQRRISDRRAVLFAGLCFFLFVIIFFWLRFHYGYRTPQHVVGLFHITDYLRYNLSLPATYMKLLMVFSVLPIFALFGWRHWPPALKRWFWVIFPAWIVIHFSVAIVAESRLFYVPVALLFVPALLIAIDSAINNANVENAAA